MRECRTVYILVTRTNTVFSRMIGLYTKSGYNHVSICLDDNFNEIYSFGRKVYWNPFYGGFSKEDGIYTFFKDTDCYIYSLNTTQRQYLNLKNRVNKFKENSYLYKYNFLGVLGIMVNKPINRQHRYFCSQFVSTVLVESGINLFDKPTALITPQDFMKCNDLELVYSGKLNSFRDSFAFTI